jgi:AraC-like DNA-binding protein
LTVFPSNKQLTDYVYISPELPLHISLNEIQRHFPAHRHDFLEFSLVIDGEGWEVVNGTRHPLQRGTFSFLLPYQVHELHAKPDAPLKLYNCMFDMSLLFSVLPSEQEWKRLLYTESSSLPYVQLSYEVAEEWLSLIRSIVAELASGDAWRLPMIKLRLAELLIRFARARDKREHPSAAGNERQLNAEPDTSIWYIIHYIHQHYREELTLSGLAQRFDRSEPQLSKEIKRHVGQTFVRFLHEVRIRHACSLLLSTDMKSIDIAVEVGFGSFQTFSRIFRELKKMTPGEYRTSSGRQADAESRQ